MLKDMSDLDYLDRDRTYYRSTWKNASIHDLEETEHCAVPSAEYEVLVLPEHEAEEKRRRVLANQALAQLTEVQRRRYLMYHVDGLNEREIAEKEGSTQQAVSKCLLFADKKIKKFLSKAKK